MQIVSKSVSRPRRKNAIGDILTPDEPFSLLEVKFMQEHEENLGAEVSLPRSGFVETSRGAVLTSDEAIEAARSKSE